MKKLISILFIFASIASFSQTVKNDTDLSTESTNEIKNKALNQTRLDNFNQNAIVSKVSTLQGFVSATGTTYTITNADRDKMIIVSNASGCTITMDDAITIGYRFNFRRTSTAGTITFVSDGTSILDFPGSANTTSDETTLETDRATATFIKRTSTTFDGIGQLGPASSGGITNSASANEIPKSDGTNIVGSGISSTSSGVITTGSWNGSDIGLSFIAQGSALSVLGVAGNSIADNASIAAGSDNYVLRRSGTTLGFGTIGDGSISDVAVSKLTGSGTVSGLTAGSAATLTTARNINGVSFNGSAAINTIDSSTPSTTGGTITLDLNNQVERVFVGSATFAGSKTLAMSNVGSNGVAFNFVFEITNVAATVIVPSNFYLSDGNYSSGTWTPSATGKYMMGGRYDSVNSIWYITILGPYVH